MTGRRRQIAIALAVLAGIADGPASACVWLPVTRVGKPLSPRAQAAADAAQARRDAAARLAEIRADVRSGRVDPAVGLADMLIPNIRPMRVETNDCGGSAVELPDISGDVAAARYFGGTELEGLDADYIPAAFRRAVGTSYSGECNVEFRARFAALLRARIRRPALNAAYVTLADRRGGVFSRYYRFPADQPAAPVPTENPYLWLHVQTVLGPGKPVTRVVADFWADVGLRAADDAFACPVAPRTWVARRDAELAKLRADKPRYNRLVKAARSRGQPMPVETSK